MIEDPTIQALDQRISRQIDHLETWRRPKEIILFETLRAIDSLYCRDIFVNGNGNRTGQFHDSYFNFQEFGVNKALQRVMPDHLGEGPFVLFPSKEPIQIQADELLFQAGILERATILRGWLAEGLLSARLDTVPDDTASGIRAVLVLKTSHPSLFAEVVGIRQRQWLSGVAQQMDRAWEEDLERRHSDILPDLVSHVRPFRGWGIEYTTTKEIDNYFDEWGQLYLRRMWSHDLLGMDDKLGGHDFRDYIGVLAAISGRSQKHLCFAGLVKHDHPKLDWRNLLTTFSPFDTFLIGLSSHLDADRLQLQQLVASLTLDPSNQEAHLGAAETAWAPLVRASRDNLILPVFGLEINPFLFLLRDLQHRYPRDWSALTDNREKRWRKELNEIFTAPRWSTAASGIVLRQERRIVTDIDAAVYDTQTNELALFQLKWQQPVGRYGRANRSAAKNIVVESNRWIERVSAWIAEHGTSLIMDRLGMTSRTTPRVTLFVLGRYNAHFAGRHEAENLATWSDWPHFIRSLSENGRTSFIDMAARLTREAEAMKAAHGQESFMVPIGDMAIIVNPSREP